jgi:hypothetical protein
LAAYGKPAAYATTLPSGTGGHAIGRFIQPSASPDLESRQHAFGPTRASLL